MGIQANYKYSIYLVEVTRSSSKRMEVIYGSDNWQLVVDDLKRAMQDYAKDRVELQLIEREDSGILAVRMSVSIDGRPFCKSAQDMGPDKYGYH